MEQGREPPEIAVQALAHAVELAPFDLGLRMNLAMDQVRRRQFAAARQTLGPIAYNPHGGGLAEAAQRVIAKIDSDPKWDGRNAKQITAGAEDADE